MKKIVGILVCMLVIAAAVLPAAGIITFNIKKVEKPVSSNTTIVQELEDTPKVNKPDGTPPQPTATKTDYLSTPTAAFIPETETINYFNWGTYLKGDGWFNAPVYFPNDATVTKVTVYWWDTSGDDLHFILIRYPIGYETEVKMAKGTSSGSGGEGFTVDDTIDSAVIDNILMKQVEIQLIFLLTNKIRNYKIPCLVK